MKASEKARELVDKMFDVEHCSIKHFPNQNYCDCEQINYGEAKQCALICVDEILAEFPKGIDNSFERKRFKYWNEVKQEIKKL